MGAIDAIPSVRRHRLTVEQYHRMAEIGVLAPDARVELIEGEVIEMAATGSRQGSAVMRLNLACVEAAAGRCIVTVQTPLRLDALSEPEPDLMLMRRREDFYASSHPTAADVLLLIVVSDTTPRYDREIKAPLYARHGVAEVWIVDLERSSVRCLADPHDGEYRVADETATPGRRAPRALSALGIDLQPLLG